MDTKILLPKEFCEDEVIGFIARRHKTTPFAVITNFLRHEGILPLHGSEIPEDAFSLADNEIAICRDLGIAPREVEITV